MVVLDLRSIRRHRSDLHQIFLPLEAVLPNKPNTMSTLGAFLVDSDDAFRYTRRVGDSAVSCLRADCALEGAGDVYLDLQGSAEYIEAMRGLSNLLSVSIYPGSRV